MKINRLNILIPFSKSKSKKKITWQQNYIEIYCYFGSFQFFGIWKYIQHHFLYNVNDLANLSSLGVKRKPFSYKFLKFKLTTKHSLTILHVFVYFKLVKNIYIHWKSTIWSLQGIFGDGGADYIFSSVGAKIVFE